MSAGHGHLPRFCSFANLQLKRTPPYSRGLDFEAVLAASRHAVRMPACAPIADPAMDFRPAPGGTTPSESWSGYEQCFWRRNLH